jgi:hypothetical protein
MPESQRYKRCATQKPHQAALGYHSPPHTRRRVPFGDLDRVVRPRQALRFPQDNKMCPAESCVQMIYYPPLAVVRQFET